MITTIAALFALALVSPVALAGHLNTVGPNDSPTHILFGECREVVGTVTDFDSGEPLENFTVVAVPAGAESLVNVYSHAHTAADGTYSLFVHNTGDYQIVAMDDRMAQGDDVSLQDAPGHEPAQHDEIVTVEDPDCEEGPAVRDFEMNALAAEDPTGTILVNLRELLATVPEVVVEPLEGQSIGLGAGSACEVVDNRTTDSDGQARFEDIPRGQDYCLIFESEDWTDNSTVVLLDSAEVEVGLNTTRGLQTISGSVSDDHNGMGIEGVDLDLDHPLFCPDQASNMPDEFGCTATTDSDGDYSFSVPWSQDDDYALEFDLDLLAGYTGTNSSSVSLDPPSEGGAAQENFPLDRTQALLEGRVLERNAPLTLATVCLDGVPGCTVTPSSGEFRLLVTWDEYSLELAHPDGTTASIPVTLDHDGEDIGDFDFDPITEGITGIVRDHTAGDIPVAGVVVEAFDEADPDDPPTAVPCGTTDADGSFFCELSPGDYTLNVTTTLYEDLSAKVGPFTVDPEDDTDAGFIDLDRRMVSVLEGVVTDGDSTASTAIEGATVQVEGTTTGIDLSETSGTGGAYGFTGLPWDTYTVTVTMDDYQQYQTAGHVVTVDDDAADPFELDPELDRTLHGITGIVVDADADDPLAVQGATVSATGRNTGSAETVATDATGGYEFTGLPWDDYELVFTHTAYLSATEGVTLLPDDLEVSDVDLDRLRSNITGFMLENKGMFSDHSALAGETFDVGCEGAETAGFAVTLTTNETFGNYTVGGLPWDTFSCTVQDPEPPGGEDHLFYEAEGTLELPPHENLTSANFTLTRQSWLVHGTVRDRVDDTPIPDIRLCINNLNDIERTAVCQRTDGDGRFSETMRYVDVGSPETNVVTIAVDGNEDYFSGVAAALVGPDLGHGDQRNVTVMPQDGGVEPPPANISLINGRVLDANATDPETGAVGVIANATHEVGCAGPQPEGASGADGNYTLAVGCEGSYDLSFSHPAGLYQEASLEDVSVQESPNVTFAPDLSLVRTTGNATVTVTDLLTQQGVQEANVTIEGIDTNTPSTWTMTDANGRANFTGLPWGAYEATVNATHVQGVVNETVTGFVVMPGENATAQAFILSQPEAPDCVGEGNQLCDPATDEGQVVLHNITSNHPGQFSVVQPQLGNVTTSMGEEHEPADGAHNGTWFVVFEAQPNGPTSIRLTATYTNETGEETTLEAENSLTAQVGPASVHTPIVWVFNLHTQSTAACLPDPLSCSDQDAGELENVKFFLPESDD